MNQSQFATRRVAILGPESSGKTTLARFLANHFKTHYAHEYVRGFLRRGRQIRSASDLFHIACKQIQIEERQAKKANHVLFCDTDLINLKIWSDEVYGKTDERLLDLISKRSYSLCLLLRPDVTWSHDGIRTGADSRDRILQIYRNELASRKIKFVEIEGLGKARYDEALGHIIKHLSS